MRPVLDNFIRPTIADRLTEKEYDYLKTRHFCPKFYSTNKTIIKKMKSGNFKCKIDKSKASEVIHYLDFDYDDHKSFKS